MDMYSTSDKTASVSKTTQGIMNTLCPPQPKTTVLMDLMLRAAKRVVKDRFTKL